MSLTAKRVLKITKPGRYGDGNNLFLQVMPSGTKSWLFRYERGGKERAMGLGPVNIVSLEQARAKARTASLQLFEGIDPLAHRRAEQQARALAAGKITTFSEGTHAYYDGNEGKWKNAKHRQQFLNTMKQYAFPVMGKLAISEIDTALVLKVVEPIWADKTVTADRVRNRIEKVLDWATVRGFRKGDNPARWKGHLSEVLPPRRRIAKTKHFAALPFAELPSFMTTLKVREGVSARALEFTILTATRTSEATGAKWTEINIAEKTWTVPADRIKGGKDHRVPLSDRAVAILEALPREGDWVFPGVRKDKPMSNMAMDAVLRRMGFKDGRATVHGFRSTFRDWAAERTQYPNHVVEMALAHTVGNKVEAAYRRGDLFDKRRLLMADWAKYCASKAAEPVTSAPPIQMEQAA